MSKQETLRKEVPVIGGVLRGISRLRPPPPESPFEGIPPFFKEPLRSLTKEKRFYFEFVGALTEEIDIPLGAKIAVLGVGAGLEVETIATVLDLRLERGETAFAENTLQSVDISPKVLENLRRKTRSERVRNSLVHADACDLSFLSDNSCALITMSSILHEIQGENGWEGVVRAFAEAERVLAPGGYLIIREFHPPPPEEQILELKTPFARKFFYFFAPNFRPGAKEEWRREWNWNWAGKNKIRTSSTFIFEILQHSRMFHKDYYERSGEKAFDFFQDWLEPKERYTLAIPRRFSGDLMEALVSGTNRPIGAYSYRYFIYPDSEDDSLLSRHFSCSQLESDGKEGKPYPFQTERMLVVFYKHPPVPTGEQRAERALEVMEGISEIIERLVKKHAY